MDVDRAVAGHRSNTTTSSARARGPSRRAWRSSRRTASTSWPISTRRNLEAIERKVRYYREVANAFTPVSSADSDHSRAASSGSAA